MLQSDWLSYLVHYQINFQNDKKKNIYRKLKITELLRQNVYSTTHTIC